MQLVIAEKPSVARSIAEVIGAVDSEDGYMEGNGYLVSWCVGHLVELAQPESYGEQWKKWTYESLPIKNDIGPQNAVTTEVRIPVVTSNIFLTHCILIPRLSA